MSDIVVVMEFSNCPECVGCPDPLSYLVGVGSVFSWGRIPDPHFFPLVGRIKIILTFGSGRSPKPESEPPKKVGKNIQWTFHKLFVQINSKNRIQYLNSNINIKSFGSELLLALIYINKKRIRACMRIKISDWIWN